MNAANLGTLAVTGVVQVSLSMSLDGYITGSDPTMQHPLGDAADIIRPGGERWMVDEVMHAAGAVVAGSTVYDQTQGWATTPRSRCLPFVPTHRPHDVRVAGETTFTFVPDIETHGEGRCRRQERLPDGRRDHRQPAPRAGLVDELLLHIEPVLLGGGARLFDELGEQRIRLERTRLFEGDPSTHLWLRVLHD